MRHTLVLAAAVLLAGCSTETPPAEDAPATGAVAEESAAPESEPLEGPVTEPFEWADGVTAQVIDVVTTAESSADNPADDTRVEVIVRFTNRGDDVFMWLGDPNALDAGPDADLLYGVNRTIAQSYYYDGNRLPTQLQPGTSAEWTSLHYMPGSELGTLAFSVAPAEGYVPYTFTGVETLV